MSHAYLPWILSACWIAAAVSVFFVLDASSGRSWIYLAVVALGPPIALLLLWPETRRQTIDDVIHGRGEQS